MFDSLSDKLQNVMKKLKGQTRISEKELKEMLREVKLALLEADVNYKVVKDFIASIEEKALGEDVMKSLTPGQQVVKIVRDELTNLLGDTNSGINFSPNPPTIIMLVGLQGSGKTTLCGKLSNYLRKQGKKPYMVACDVYRPAAIKQLQTLGKSLGVDVYSEENNKNVVEIAKNGIKAATSKLCNVVLIDTAGRLQIDEALMNELVDLKKAIRPHEIMLVIDSMVGQEAVNVARDFNEKLGIDSITMSKLDSDTRGGAALSVKSITKKPIKFASVGEKLSDLEPFYPKSEFTLDDYLAQMKKIRKMGSFKSLLAMIPGIPKEIKDVEIDEKQLLRIDAIITSMTKEERRNPKILNASRRQRISKGSGNTVQDINRFIDNFTQMQKMMKNMMNGNGKYPKMPGMDNLFK